MAVHNYFCGTIPTLTVRFPAGKSRFALQFKGGYASVESDEYAMIIDQFLEQKGYFHGIRKVDPDEARLVAAMVEQNLLATSQMGLTNDATNLHKLMSRSSTPPTVDPDVAALTGSLTSEPAGKQAGKQAGKE